MDLLIFLLFGVGLMWLLIVLPQRRRQNEQRRMIESLKPGDYIVTSGGMYGTITELGEEDLGLEVAPDVEVRVAKRAVGALIPPDEIEDEEVAEADEPPAAPSSEGGSGNRPG